MNDKFDIIIPRETVNDDFVVIAEWYYPNGQKVQKGDMLLSIETSKALLELVAEQEGYLEILHDVKTQIEVGSVVGILHKEEIQKAGIESVIPHSITKMNEFGKKGTIFSNKAKILIEKNNIDLTEFSEMTFVKEEDVIEYINKTELNTIKKEDSEHPIKSVNKGLFKELLLASQNRRKSPFFIIVNYIFKNYLLGLLVRIAPIPINIFLHKLRGVKIGKDVFIDPTATIETAYPEYIYIGNDV
ncbi:MAG: hypothetical protein C0412_19625, partial [Flavobacterium sp.]|nr:hypothetical protein [Flavobacterium sp.]